MASDHSPIFPPTGQVFTINTYSTAGNSTNVWPLAPKAKPPEDALAWLDRRVDEVRDKAFSCR